MSALDELWLILLELTNNVVVIPDRVGNVRLAHVDGAYFSLVAKKVLRFEETPDGDNYNIATRWQSSLFHTPGSGPMQLAAGKIRDPTIHCCPDLSWSLVHPNDKIFAVALAVKAANKTLEYNEADTETKRRAQEFINMKTEIIG